MTHNSDYEVGYCRPPEKGRIKPGERRNPNGRRGKNGAKRELGATGLPKTAKDKMADAVIEEMLLPVTVKNAKGKTEKLPRYQAMVRKWMAEALSHPTSAAARKLLTDIAAQAVDHDAKAKREWADFVTDNKSALDEILKKQREARADAERRGDRWHNGVVDLVPHPANFVANPFTGEYRIDGPLTEQENRLEGEFLCRRGDAEITMRQSMSAYSAAMSDEERQLHRNAHAHARSIWLHYNAKVSLRLSQPVHVLERYDLDREPEPERDDDF